MGMSRRARLAVVGATVILLAACSKPEAKPSPVAALGDLTSAEVTTTPDAPPAAATTAPPTTTSTTKPKTSSSVKSTPSSKKAADKPAMPAPTQAAHPPDIPVPPAPHPPPVPGCAPTLSGENATKPDVKAALLAAGGRQYWATATNPPLVAVDPPEGTPPPATPQLGDRAVITVPSALIQAIAWQESGWQSAIQACDGGVGTMQIMDATAKWMNQRFRTSYDYKTLAGNTALGAQYIEWLIAYFGQNNFGYHYDITNPDLLTAVLVGYNAGPGAVQFADGHTVASRYATNVKALMSSQPWGS
jgi:Transglycosylase SLT domain